MEEGDSMKEALEMRIYGIKCDNPNCDYNDMKVEFKEYDKWLNKPCPKCGENLLTEKDYKSTKTLIGFVKVMNKILPKRKEDEEVATMTIDMDGTGKIDTRITK